MSERTNKYGLKDSDLKEKQKRKIRQDAGYGCVICGALFIQYEHIEPEFHEAKEHDPDKMTLLCGSHHDDVSHKRITKKSVWDHKRNPKNKSGEIIKRSLYHKTIDTQIYFGENTVGSLGNKTFDSIITIKGKPIIWFEKNHDEEAPLEVCAIFHDLKGLAHSYINRNCFITTVANYDIKGKGSRIIISDNGSVIFTLNFEGDKTLRIERVNVLYKDFSININTKGMLKIKNGSSVVKISSSSLGKLSFGGIDETRMKGGYVISAIYIAIRSAIYGNKIISFNGEEKGWITDGMIINKRYSYVAKLDKKTNEVLDLREEFIANLKGFTIKNESIYMILTKSVQYDSGEPIWIDPLERNIKSIMQESGYDLSYRIFESNSC